MRKLLALCMSFFLAALPALGAQEIDKAKMSKGHQAAYDASVAIYGTLPSSGITHFLCTGTVVATKASQPAEQPGAENQGAHDYLILTAGHCFVGDDMPPGLVFHVADVIYNEKSPELQASWKKLDVLRAEDTNKYDFALAAFRSDKVYPVIGVDFKTVPAVETKVYNVNYSIGLIKQVSVGEVASEVMTDPAKTCEVCVGRYLVHVFDGPGSSGSAIIDEKSDKIVGILELGFEENVGIGAETTTALYEWLQTPPAPQDANPKG